MTFYEMDVFIQAIFLVSIGLFGTMAEEPYCPMRYFEERLLEKVMSLELKSDMTLERLDELTTSQNTRRKSVGRPTSHLSDDAVRIEDIEHDDWELVFRATSGNEQNVYKAWTKGQSTCDSKPETMQRSNACHYRSPAVSAWSALNVKMVKLAFYTREKEVAYIIFNGDGSDSTNWFAKSRVISSSWPDLTNAHEFNYFSIDGHADLDRRFFINRHYNGCDNDLGHIAVLDTNTNIRCKWDRQPLFPQFLYSRIKSVDYWNTMQFGRADYMAIFIQTTFDTA